MVIEVSILFIEDEDDVVVDDDDVAAAGTGSKPIPVFFG